VFSQATFALCPESDPQKGFPFNKSPQVQSPVLCCSVKLPPFCLRSELRPWSPAGGRQGNKNAQHSNRAHFHKPKLLPKSPHRQGALPLQKTSLNPRLSSQAKNNPRVTTETHLVSCDEHHVFSQATFGISSSHHGNTSGWLRRAPRVFPSDLWNLLESPRKHIWLVATSTTCFPKRPLESSPPTNDPRTKFHPPEREHSSTT